MGPVAAVIPTAGRLADLRRCLDAVRGGSVVPEVVAVVDNRSSDGTREYLQSSSDLTAVLLEENVGAPGGFAAGIERVFEAGAEAVWLLDDDAVPAANALEELLGALGEAPGPRVAGAVPTIEFGDGRLETGWLWGPRAQGEGQSPNIPSRDGGVAFADVDWAPFAGLLLRRVACESIGAIRADFFLWHADVEYCLRLRRAGWLLCAAPNAVVRHPAMPLVERRLLGRRVAVGRIPPAREYYDARNRWLLLRALRGTELAYGKPLWRRAAGELARAVAVLVADPAGTRRLRMRLRGLLDGIRGDMGRRPELEGR